ncbi:unnamed protein product [Owenia fusiformis]|uniref:Uncharacterized protein n=1 Tax=Owenia fusiformis TaxID=6347 RepID=A0A8J1XXT6_OWEFU|nr:unnamed protein product [Owenia fusiformis]
MFSKRATNKLAMSKKRKKHQGALQQEVPSFLTNFSEMIRLSPPPAPPLLLRGWSGSSSNQVSTKVKVMLRISPSYISARTNHEASVLSVDPRKKQVTVFDPSNVGYATSNKRSVSTAPKMFGFDSVFCEDDSLSEICGSSLIEIIQAVVDGTDGCLFSYGHSKVGKTFTMIGVDDNPQNMGIIPCAVAWLFRLINEQKDRTGARFSVRVSAVEVTGKQEKLKDLLSEVAAGADNGGNTAPGVYLRDDPICGAQLENQSELRAPTAEKAAYYLDAAIAARSAPATEEEARNSHLLFTLHVYQYRVEKVNRGLGGGVAGGRSRLHLIDLGSCSKAKDGSQALSLSALGNVITALLNGQRHVPNRDSKLTQLMRESLGNLSCRTCMIAHVSPNVTRYNESLQVIQLAARIHRMRRRRTSKFSSASSDDSGSSCSDRMYRRRVPRLGTLREGPRSDPEFTDSSEQSCDTVIYVGRNGLPMSDIELTDGESPPKFFRRTSGSRSSGDESSYSNRSGGSGKRMPRTNPMRRGPSPTVEMLLRTQNHPPQLPNMANYQPPPPGQERNNTLPPGSVARIPQYAANPGVQQTHRQYPGSPVPGQPPGQNVYPGGQGPPTSQNIYPGMQGPPTGYPGVHVPYSGANAYPGSQIPHPQPGHPAPINTVTQYHPGAKNMYTTVQADVHSAENQAPPPNSEFWVDGPPMQRQNPAGAVYPKPNKGSEQWIDGPQNFVQADAPMSPIPPRHVKRELYTVQEATHRHLDQSKPPHMPKSHIAEISKPCSQSPKPQITQQSETKSQKDKAYQSLKQSRRTEQSPKLHRKVLEKPMNPSEAWIDGPNEMTINKPKGNVMENPKPCTYIKTAQIRNIGDAKTLQSSPARVHKPTEKTLDTASLKEHTENSSKEEEALLSDQPPSLVKPFVIDWVEKHSTGNPSNKTTTDTCNTTPPRHSSPHRSVTSSKIDPAVGGSGLKYTDIMEMADQQHQQAVTDQPRSQGAASNDASNPASNPASNTASNTSNHSSPASGLYKDNLPPPSSPSLRCAAWIKSLCQSARALEHKGSDSNIETVEITNNLETKIKTKTSCANSVIAQSNDNLMACQTSIETQKIDIDYMNDKITVTTTTEKKNFQEMLCNNRESIYEIELDDNLEQGRRNGEWENDTFSSASLPMTSMSTTYDKAPALTPIEETPASASDILTELKPVDNPKPNCEIHECLDQGGKDVSPTVDICPECNETVSGKHQCEGGSYNTEDSNRKIGLPTCLRVRPDGASNTSLNEIANSKPMFTYGTPLETIESETCSMVSSKDAEAMSQTEDTTSLKADLPSPMSPCVPLSPTLPISPPVCNIRRDVIGQSMEDTRIVSPMATPASERRKKQPPPVPIRTSSRPSTPAVAMSPNLRSKSAPTTPSRLARPLTLAKPSLESIEIDPVVPTAATNSSPIKISKEKSSKLQALKKSLSNQLHFRSSANGTYSANTIAAKNSALPKSPSVKTSTKNSTPQKQTQSKNTTPSKVIPSKIPSSSKIASPSTKSAPSSKTSSPAKSLSSQKTTPTKSRLPIFGSSKPPTSPAKNKDKKDKSKVGNERVSKLMGGKNTKKGNESDSGNDSSASSKEKKFLSPYSFITRPRPASHSSSGHGSDISSNISGHKIPSKKSETSSGYESLVHDITGSSSPHDSTDESSCSDKDRGSPFKMPKKGKWRSKSAPPRANIAQGSPSFSRAWPDTKLKDLEPVTLTDYQHEDLENQQRRRKKEAEVQAVVERRKRINELRDKQAELKEQLGEAKAKLSAGDNAWTCDLRIAALTNREDDEYVEELEKETSILQKIVETCQSRIMMVTSFDITI